MHTNDLAVSGGDEPAAEARGRNDSQARYLAGHGNDIRPLTGLRGVAALWVVVHHMLLETPLPGPLNNLAHHGYLAVDVFFILSGFVMSLTYEHMFREHLFGRGYAIFLIRRLARIYPLYIVTVVAVAALNFAGLSHSWSGGFGNFLVNVIMVQGWGFGDSINSPTWSISTEFGAYLLFPAFTVLMLRQQWVRITLAILFFAGIAVMSCLPLDQADRNGPLDICNTATIYPLLRCLCEFGIGMAVYVAAKDPRIARMCSGGWVSALVVILLFACLLAPGTDMAVVVATPFIIIIGATSGKSPISRFLGSTPVFFLGEISYSVYLLHSQFLRIYRLGTPLLERHHVPHALAVVITSVALYGSLIAVSYLAFRYLEAPMRKAIRGLEDRVQARVADALIVKP